MLRLYVPIFEVPVIGEFRDRQPADEGACELRPDREDAVRQPASDGIDQPSMLTVAFRDPFPPQQRQIGDRRQRPLAQACDRNGDRRQQRHSCGLELFEVSRGGRGRRDQEFARADKGQLESIRRRECRQYLIADDVRRGGMTVDARPRAGNYDEMGPHCITHAPSPDDRNTRPIIGPENALSWTGFTQDSPWAGGEQRAYFWTTPAYP